MKIELMKITLKDTKEIWEMQVKSFGELLDKYQDVGLGGVMEGLGTFQHSVDRKSVV